MLKLGTQALPQPTCWCHGFPSATAGQTRLLVWVLLLGLGLALLEAIASHRSHSLALFADASHLAGDAIAVGLALLASVLARHAPRPTQSQRITALAAGCNGLGLTLMAGAIASEAWHHLQAPATTILSGPMLLTALLGLLINGFNALLLARASRQDLNLRGVFWHILADAASASGTLVAALAIHFWGWCWLDALLGFGVATLMASGALPLVRQSWQAWRIAPSPPSLQASGFYELGRTDLRQVLGRGNPGAKR